MNGEPQQVLLGVTGSGKTFTMANVIQNVEKPTLVLAHNKTLAAQLYSEFKQFFPNNSVQYFVSYYDYYQPEAYIPVTGVFIEKDLSINDELEKLKRYFDNNLEFYKYYRTNNTFIDDKLFVRGKYDIKLSLDTYYFEADHNFSTSHDYKAAKIIANDLIQVYLEDQLHSPIHKSKSIELPNLNWRGSKTALTELIYALHAQGVFDNTDIKVIAKTFESIFNVDLGDFYHTFMELKARKINRTKFLDSLRDALIKRMDELEEDEY